ncbi:MAG TPA: aminodeoxychorismate/anthranilate synthase component II [Pirellulaceae bacterium]|nr:aminodeoxychorismate/anthranilate synthase component II [Pirellulaceae bacterium]HMO93871.1 aminodeoxychorismate/anthranilate synthase component II [Pirellulaceae bacterium]HMP67711.1 aminodeoxychorismate/anthranilate synthase component II [Pirellulaceae bacterium]
MVLVIDNYDSFTFNLVQIIGELTQGQVQVFRNDQISVEQILEMSPSHLVLSPGPCTPDQAGVSMSCIRRLSGKLPILGVCLGHQSIGQATGGQIVRANKLMHGKTDLIHHDATGLFQALPSPFRATRYHSLVIDPASLSDEFVVNAWSFDHDQRREIMGISHRKLPVFGLQFHPESFLTEHGTVLVRNFLTNQYDRN